MDRPDHMPFRDWLDLEADGCLAAEQRAALDQHLAVCADCRNERAELQQMLALLRSASITVGPEFRERVMASLPAAGWEARHPRTWTFPVAVCALLMAVGAGLLAASSRLGSAYSVAAAVSGMLRAVVMAGAGLITSSWRWIGMFASDKLSSPMSLTAFAVFVLCLNLLLVSLIRRRRGGEPQGLGAPSPPRADRRRHDPDQRERGGEPRDGR
ncbi:MAG TPA: zf-HC2 domain-containing protein [Thermoanaerobaculia bacterium]|nr:zf-HC2 domain-containing protein [Thermoanaerobaculia bacterium]